MSIKFVDGDMFHPKSNFDVRVNTVNCVGVMGKGVALEFKKRYPLNNFQYQNYCKMGLLKPGCVHVCFETSGINCPVTMILNVATKMHWKSPSKMNWIKDGVWNLVGIFNRLPMGTTASIPALGCGNGGLDWIEVKKYIRMIFKSNSNNMEITVFNPQA